MLPIRLINTTNKRRLVQGYETTSLKMNGKIEDVSNELDIIPRLTRTPELHDFQISSIRLLFESYPVRLPDKIGCVIEEVDLVKQINLEADSDDVQELLDFHKQELTMDELIEIREQKQDTEEESLHSIKSEDRMWIVGNSIEGISSIE
ncbi:hypothetical protein TNCV_1245291 [Trichonephila clavipes]|nr:hypothetical protein TNCV_1245291 [Trichonephila clavipes]